MDWFLYDNGLRHERVKTSITFYQMKQILVIYKRSNTWIKWFSIKISKYNFIVIVLWVEVQQVTQYI